MKPDPYAYNKQTRIVYGYFDINDTIVYIGSSYLPIEKISYNHRNAFTLWPEEKHTRFRTMLKEYEPDKGTFRRLIELECTRPVIESFEGQLIRAFTPYYNDDMDPVASSKLYGRY
jgi:hypothetical protein